MKIKTLLMVSCIGVSMLFAVSCGSKDDTAKQTSGQVISEQMDVDKVLDDGVVTQAESITIALEHLGISMDDVDSVYVESNTEGGNIQYDVHFSKDDVESVYVVDSVTGEVAEKTLAEE